MPEVPVYPIPTSYLDKAVARLAITEARKLIAQGHSPDQAATITCQGTRLEWRAYVLVQLHHKS